VRPVPVRPSPPAASRVTVPPHLTSAVKTPAQPELLVSLGRLRQAFREVAGIVEGLGALRSLGGEEALIEMAMFAQSHEQTLERVWRALADCEEVARQVVTAPPAPTPYPQVVTAPPAPSPYPSEPTGPLTTDPAPMPPEDMSVESAPAPGGEALDEDGPVTQVDGPQTRVLVVDDDPAVLRAFRRVLQGDHEIVTARDGAEALGIVMGGARVDAIICDIGMPKLDGPAFFSELFELRPQLMPRVVFCTGGLPNEKTQRFLERLQAPLLFKPVAAADLQRAIDMVRSR